MSFSAKYPGDCMDCDDGIHSGEHVEFDDDRNLRHVMCPDLTDRSGAPRPVCPRCFLVVLPNGTCGYCEPED